MLGISLNSMYELNTGETTPSPSCRGRVAGVANISLFGWEAEYSVGLLLKVALSTNSFARDAAAPYSMVYCYLSDDPAQLAGCSSHSKIWESLAHALVYCWQAETLDGDYWKRIIPRTSSAKGITARWTTLSASAKSAESRLA